MLANNNNTTNVTAVVANHTSTRRVYTHNPYQRVSSIAAAFSTSQPNTSSAMTSPVRATTSTSSSATTPTEMPITAAHTAASTPRSSSSSSNSSSLKGSRSNSDNIVAATSSSSLLSASAAINYTMLNLSHIIINPNGECGAAASYGDLRCVHNATLHRELIGRVSFVPYPSESIDFDAIAAAADDHYVIPPQQPVASSSSSTTVSNDSFGSTCSSSAEHSIKKSNSIGNSSEYVRLFLGQLPYRVTDMQLRWLVYVFGCGATIHAPERITKKNRSGGPLRVPTGCVHAHIRESSIPAVIAGMNKRMLIDDSGVWFAQSETERAALEHYCAVLKADPRRRAPERPYDTVVAQEAVSVFQPPQPRWVSNAPELEQFAPSLPPKRSSPASASLHFNNAGHRHHSHGQQFHNAAAVSSMVKPTCNNGNNHHAAAHLSYIHPFQPAYISHNGW